MIEGLSTEEERQPIPVTLLPTGSRTKDQEPFQPPDDYSPQTTEFVVKTYELCNLACTYCYMYELRDKSYLQQPAAMSYDTIEQTAARVGEHAEEYELENVKIIFHGGEPLVSYLLDKDYYRRATQAFRATLGERADFNMQTNGVLIAKHPEVLDMLHEVGIKIGISIDGDPETHDMLRIKRDGSGSFAEVAAGIRAFARWNEEAGSKKAALGLLGVVNTEADPHKVYDTITNEEFGAASFDLLLPLAHHSMLPPGYGPDYEQPGSPTPYADWLIPLYDRWAQEDAGRMSMRLFRSIQRLIVGKNAKAEYIGNSFARNLVIEANGDMVLPDSYRSVGDGVIGLRDDNGDTMNVETHSISEAARHRKVVGYRLGKRALSATCQECHVVDICGAGLQANRWRDDSSLEAGGSFENPSVYCQDLMKLILHISDSLESEIQNALAPTTTTG